MAEKKIIIGLTGPIAGGKGTVGELLRQKGFFFTSLSDRIREEIAQRGEEITRKRLQEVGDELREKFGANVLAERTWALVSQKEKAVIDSIRSLGEVKFLQTKPGFFLIGVDAPPEIRYQRMKERGLSGEPLTWEEFIKLDEKDIKSGLGETGRDIQACLERADFLIENTGTLTELQERVEEILKTLEEK